MPTVGIYGAGQLGNGVARILRSRGRHQVLGPYPRAQRIDALTGGADVVLIATTTRLHDILPDVRTAVASGSNVLISAEESANPWLVDPIAANEVSAAAVQAGVTVLGAGLNPGLIFDALVLTVIGAASDDVEIAVRRTVDISGFGPTVLSRIGVGITPADFEIGVDAGDVLGHAGFPQSMSVVARALGLTLDGIEPQLAPLIATKGVTLADGRLIAAGLTAGVDQTYRAFVDGRPWYTAHFVGHVQPAEAGLAVQDVITLLRGDEIVHEVQVRPGFPAQSGSQHVLANSVDRVIAAPAGWLTVSDLPPAARHTGH